MAPRDGSLAATATAEVLRTSWARNDPRPGRGLASLENQVTPGDGEEATESSLSGAGGSRPLRALAQRCGGQLRTPLGPRPLQLQCPPRPPGALWLRLSGGGGGALGRDGKRELEAPEPSRAGRAGRRRSRAGWRAAGRRHGGAERGRDEAPDSGHRQDPQGQGGDRHLRSSLGQGGSTVGGREEGGSSARRGQRRDGDLGDGLAAGTGPRPGGAQEIRAGEAGRGRPARASPGSVARAVAGLSALPCLGAWWESLWKGHLTRGHRGES